METGSQTLTTYYAKRIIGDTAAADAAAALLQTGANIHTHTWILYRDDRATDVYGIKYKYAGESYTDDKIEFYGGYQVNSVDIPTAWIQLDTGDLYVLGNVGIGHAPDTYKLYVNGTSYFTNTITIDNGCVNGEVIRIIGAANKVFSFKLSGDTTAGSNVDIGWNWTNVEGAGAAFRSTSFPSQEGEFRIYARKRNSSDVAVYTQLIGTPGNTTDGGNLSWGGSASIGASSSEGYKLYVNGTTYGTSNCYFCLSSGLATFGDTVQLSSPWTKGDVVIGKNGTDKIVAGYLASSTNGATIGAHVSALNGWAPLYVAGTQIYIRGSETTWAKWTNGCLSLFPTLNDYREGIRIHSYNSWSDITLCGNDNTGDNGISANSWFIGNNNGNFYISRNGSNTGGSSWLECIDNQWRFRTPSAINFLTTTGTAQNIMVNAIGCGNDYSKFDLTNFRAHINGRVLINNSSDVTPNAGTGALVIGATGGLSIGIDDNEIMARNGTAVSTLYINSEGGTVQSGGSFYSSASPGFNNQVAAGAWAYLRLHNGSTLWDIATRSDISSGALQLRPGGGDLGYYFIAGNIPEGAANLSAAASQHSIHFYRNGFTIPYLMDNANDGGMFRVRGTSESTCICEIGTWDDSGAGETIQFNYYPTTSQITPTYSVSVPKASGTICLTNGTGASGTWGISITGRAYSLKDRTNDNTTYLNYGAAGLAGSAISWMCCWNGYEVRAISKAETFNVVRDNGGDSRWINTAGDTMTGALHFANGTLNNVGDDCAMGDQNVAGAFCLKGLNGATNIRFIQYGGTAAGTISWDGTKFSMTGTVSTSISGNAGTASKFYVTGSSSTLYLVGVSGYSTENKTGYIYSPNYISGGNLYSTKVYNAVWNDYAECRQVETEEPGYCVTETETGTMIKTTKRLQAGCKITSDTFGTCMGETETAKTPIAVAGRVLVYPYRNRSEYKLGAAVCSAPNGMVDIMTRDEIMMYPECIVGTVSEIPNYEVWQSGNKEFPQPIDVNGRIWIYVR